MTIAEARAHLLRRLAAGSDGVEEIRLADGLAEIDHAITVAADEVARLVDRVQAMQDERPPG